MTLSRQVVFRRAGLAALAAVATCASVAIPRDREFATPAVHAPASPASLPDITGPGHVLTSGKVFMKVTNNGILGNPFTNLSSDPSGQWPGASGIEYLTAIQLAVGAVDPLAPPGSAHHVSYSREWAPASLDPVDHIYTTQSGAAQGARYGNDDGDLLPDGFSRFDEDFLDGRDNDGDGLIDEDFGALGSQMFSLVMRDDGPLSTASGEPHVPIGLECRLAAWAYADPGLRDFNPIELTIINRSGHQLDSVYVGFSVDMDCGPSSVPLFFADDRSLGGYPSGEFTRVLVSGDPQRQFPHASVLDASADSALCARTKVRVNGFSMTDNDGDGGATPGVASFLLLDHTLDFLGVNGLTRVGFTAFRSFTAGTPWSAGGNPTTDSQRWEFLSSHEGIDPTTGFIAVSASPVSADHRAWCSVGPFRNVPANGSVSATIVFAVERGSYAEAAAYAADYTAYQAGSLSSAALLAAHPALENAFAAQVLHDGTDRAQPGAPVADFHGRETPLRAPSGQVLAIQGCPDRDPSPRFVNDQQYSWFDFDCDYCTGVWDAASQQGLAHQTWTSNSPTLSVPPTPSARAIALAVTPNPAPGLARVRFTLASAEAVDVSVFDTAGRRIRSLLSGRLEAGEHDVAWEGEDEAGRPAGAGVYLIRLAAAGRTSAVRVVRMR